MKVIIFGATGMIGQGVLAECLKDEGIAEVLAVLRSPTGRQHAKLRELIHRDFFDYSLIEADLAGYDACFFCLGVTSVGMKEEDYRRLTYDLTVAAASTLARLNPQMTFVFVSGKSADSTEKGSVMWARVKGAAENAVLALPFKGYVFRPSIIQPTPGITSKTGLYRAVYATMGVLLPLIKRLAPDMVITSEQFGRAMIRVARQGASKRVLEPADINAL
ncbi:MAG: NAD(P)H-binding protein [Phreatobacter sp.]|uniref:NAD(P)H-binding protein n=1 Tax=Phreatobacter sp. TaxID=1966341 RepID=UPI001A3FDB98|nr:NAD(P)H-binding protein [Phreatobacter sp.]MBL8568922.1 NAD(P)H-binding protein [Phreatobacter sp.]